MSDFEDRVRDELHQLAERAEPGPTLRQRIDARLGTGPPPMGRPPVALAAVAAAIVLVAATLVVLAARGHGGGNKLVLTQGTSTTLGVPSTLGLALGVSSVTATSAPPVSDSTTAAPTTTATTVSPTTTAPTTTTLATTTTVAVVDCSSSDLEARAATDKPQYPAGAPVTITVTITNVSGRGCQVQQPMPGGFAPPIRIVPVAAPSMPVWPPAPIANGVLPYFPPKVLAPNESYQWTTADWNQHSCASPCTGRAGDNGQVPSGIYQASPINPPGTAVPVDFTIGP